MSDKNEKSVPDLLAGGATPTQKTALDMLVDAMQKQAEMSQVMLAREARLAKAEEDAEKARQAREVQRDRNAKSSFEDERVIQTKCKHLKGGKHRSRVQVTDYAVYHFTYANMERVIRCFLCKMKWKTQDTREFLIRNGKRVVNHTKLGWEDAAHMLEQTSNTPSSCEIAYKLPEQEPEVEVS